MKKLLAVLLALLLLSTVFGIATDDTRISSIRPQHDNGFFVEFSSIGYSFANQEINSQPLLDVLGIFNLGFRYYITKDSLLNTEGYFIDPQFVPTVYAGEERYDPSYFILLGRAYLHGDYQISNFSIKPHVEVLGGGALMDQYYAVGTLGKAVLTGSFAITKNVEFFTRIESGMLGNILSSSTDTSIQESIDEVRQETIYLVTNVGLTWYYDTYSGIEIGYRYFLLNRDSPLTYFQGFSYTDYVFNYFKLINDSLSTDQRINIPFITTDYYITFSIKF
ncbi:MAG TPA: hypothetical protein PK258_06890 [Fervidobacterium sp.]|nr:hypothetical protein [Fervidobacterium sp.]HRT02245.1 hypothetical protein [Fervidobacterium sp.]HRV38489.1 hypothetical protein [Fervidobacterium sp.]